MSKVHHFSMHTVLVLMTQVVARVGISRPGFNENHLIGRTDPLTGEAARRTAIVPGPGDRVYAEIYQGGGSVPPNLTLIMHASGRLISAEFVTP